jgi:uncharacterized metal-binding protein
MVKALAATFFTVDIDFMVQALGLGKKNRDIKDADLVGQATGVKQSAGAP